MFDENNSAGQVHWDRFPNQEHLHAELEKCNEDIKPTGSRPATPYHFTLRILSFLYWELLGISLPHEGCGKNGPEQFDFACNAQLRAIAFFSWHGNQAVFLARRIFPTYFDFLTYSHVPAGWGALGQMLYDMRRNRTQRDFCYSRVDIVTELPILLPYLEEAHRLHYKTVITLPVYTTKVLDHREINGAFVFYLRDSSSIPISHAVEENFKGFSVQLGNAVEEHRKSIASLKCRVEENSRWHDGIRPGKGCHGRIRIEIAHRDDLTKAKTGARTDLSPKLKKIAESVVSALSSVECYGVPIKDAVECNKHTCTVLFSGRHGFRSEELRHRIQLAVGAACETFRGEFISWNVEYHGTLSTRVTD